MTGHRSTPSHGPCLAVLGVCAGLCLPASAQATCPPSVLACSANTLCFDVYPGASSQESLAHLRDVRACIPDPTGPAYPAAGVRIFLHDHYQGSAQTADYDLSARSTPEPGATSLIGLSLGSKHSGKDVSAKVVWTSAPDHVSAGGRSPEKPTLMDGSSSFAVKDPLVALDGTRWTEISGLWFKDALFAMHIYGAPTDSSGALLPMGVDVAGAHFIYSCSTQVPCEKHRATGVLIEARNSGVRSSDFTGYGIPIVLGSTPDMYAQNNDIRDVRVASPNPASQPSAIQAAATYGTVISNNHLENIDCGGIVATPGSYKQRAAGPFVEYNEIVNPTLACGDVGALSGGPMIRYNHVYRTGRSQPHGVGVYLDDCASDVTVVHNLICDQEIGISVVGGSRDTIVGNVFCRIPSTPDPKSGATRNEVVIANRATMGGGLHCKDNAESSDWKKIPTCPPQNNRFNYNVACDSDSVSLATMWPCGNQCEEGFNPYWVQDQKQGLCPAFSQPCVAEAGNLPKSHGGGDPICDVKTGGSPRVRWTRGAIRQLGQGIAAPDGDCYLGAEACAALRETWEESAKIGLCSDEWRKIRAPSCPPTPNKPVTP